MRVQHAIRRFIDVQAHWLATWLHSRWAFVQLVYGSLLWIPLVALGIDGHGFLYLYIATTLSLITQVPLAMLSWWSAQEGRRNETLMAQSLTNQTDMMKVLLDHGRNAQEQLEATYTTTISVQKLLDAVKQEVEEQDEELSESRAYLKKLSQIGERAMGIRQLRESVLRREEHMHTVHGLAKALSVGLEEGGLAEETRRRIYAEMEAEFKAWATDRDESEDILQAMRHEMHEVVPEGHADGS